MGSKKTVHLCAVFFLNIHRRFWDNNIERRIHLVSPAGSCIQPPTEEVAMKLLTLFLRELVSLDWGEDMKGILLALILAPLAMCLAWMTMVI